MWRSTYRRIVKSDGSVYTFGYGPAGQLGLGNTSSQTTPTLITDPNIIDIIAVSCGGRYTAFLKSDGTVYTVGSNTSGELGLGVSDYYIYNPTEISGNHNDVIAISCGYYHTAILHRNIIDNKITVTTTSNSDLSLVNNTITGDGFTSITNYITESNTYNNGKIILTQETGNDYNINNSTTFDNNELVISNFTNNASIPFNTIGTYQIINKFIKSLLNIKNKILIRNKLLEEIDTNIKFFTFGFNDYGQLGDGTTTNRNIPTQISGNFNDIIAVSCGDYHTAILKSDGTVYTVGRNDYGQLGDGTTTDRNTLTEITDSNATNIIAVSCGRYHTAILKSDGSVYTFGWNFYGALGNGTTTNRNTPTKIQGHEDVIAVSCGGYHTAIVKSDGTVYTFGFNDNGQLGNGTTTDRNTPTEITDSNATNIIAVSCGGRHTAILKSDGTVYTFGYNSNGQLGDGTTTNKTTPTEISGNHNDVIAISCGYDHTAIVKSDGTVYTFGRNHYGQLGLGDTTQKTTPTQIQGHEDVIAVSCGYSHTAILKSDGTVYTFGFNDNGQLGDGTTTNKNIPIKISGNATSIQEVSCGALHTAIIQKNRILYDNSTLYDNSINTNMKSTHQSSITDDKSRGNLESTTTTSNQKPFIFENNGPIKYSEDAIFTLLKGIGYEIFKLSNGITGNNNGVDSTKAGISNIPISISDHNNISPHKIKNKQATIENINKISNSIDINALTSEQSIPRDTVGLIELINKIKKLRQKKIKNIENMKLLC